MLTLEILSLELQEIPAFRLVSYKSVRDSFTSSDIGQLYVQIPNGLFRIDFEYEKFTVVKYTNSVGGYGLKKSSKLYFDDSDSLIAFLLL